MSETNWQAAQFEEHRAHLRAVAYRMLGSLSEADDAVQDAWLRSSRADTDHVENMRGWLTTVVARVCLNILRKRRARGEESLEARLPEPIVSTAGEPTPEQESLLADAVGMAMLVVMDTLSPPERVAFVLHDVFGLTFDEIAPIVGRSTPTTRQLASRARRRMRRTDADSEADLPMHQALVDAFLAAAREGDIGALIAVLDPDVVLRADLGPAGGGLITVRGAQKVAAQARTFSPLAPMGRRVLVNGAPGLAVIRDGQPYSVLAFTVRGGRIAEIDVVADPDRLHGVALARDL